MMYCIPLPSAALRQAVLASAKEAYLVNVATFVYDVDAFTGSITQDMVGADISSLRLVRGNPHV